MEAPARYHRITAKELFDWMQWHGLSQTDLAKGLSCSRSTVYNWLEGHHRAPASLYGRLCALYGEPFVPEYKPHLNATWGWGGKGPDGKPSPGEAMQSFVDHIEDDSED